MRLHQQRCVIYSKKQVTHKLLASKGAQTFVQGSDCSDSHIQHYVPYLHKQGGRTWSHLSNVNLNEDSTCIRNEVRTFNTCLSHALKKRYLNLRLQHIKSRVSKTL